MKKNSIILGSGLVSLDVIFEYDLNSPKYFAGGTCGNVLTITSFLGKNSYPIARLGKNKLTSLVLADIKKWGTNTDFISISESGSTPVIIHRVIEDKNGNPKHKFEFKDPYSGKWLPNFKPYLAKNIETIKTKIPPKIGFFFFDRANRASIELAKICRERGSIIMFEPSSFKDEKIYHECLEIAHIVKYSNERIKSNFENKNILLEIQTLGVEGLRFRISGGKWISSPSYNVPKVVDAAGAGDWCSAGIINYFFENHVNIIKGINENEITNAVKYGQALAALNCMFIGARGLMYNINKNEVQNLVSSYLKMKPIAFNQNDNNMSLKNGFSIKEFSEMVFQL
ncbi:MAG: PfkB family carbohydrate kinase [Saprospiraceae bacterium]